MSKVDAASHVGDSGCHLQSLGVAEDWQIFLSYLRFSNPDKVLHTENSTNLLNTKTQTGSCSVHNDSQIAHFGQSPSSYYFQVNTQFCAGVMTCKAMLYKSCAIVSVIERVPCFTKAWHSLNRHEKRCEPVNLAPSLWTILTGIWAFWIKMTSIKNKLGLSCAKLRLS